MKYVLDSSVAFKWVVTEMHSDKARGLRDEFRRVCTSFSPLTYSPSRLPTP